MVATAEMQRQAAGKLTLAMWEYRKTKEIIDVHRFLKHSANSLKIVVMAKTEILWYTSLNTLL